ncbi:hypothetical protein [Salinibius halmophilus]|uniref:hypothetical protein n=1 Tax=Salinibius halmophilus TaxID=1853216 RepID=UPI000E675FD3|nr:hypothetical protein [Salinibius halmophilus]
MTSLLTATIAHAEWTAGLGLAAQTSSSSDVSAKLNLDAGWQKQWQHQQLTLGYSASVDQNQDWQLTGATNWAYQRQWLTLSGGHQRSVSASTNDILDLDTELTDAVNLAANFIANVSSTTQLTLFNSASATGASKRWPQSSSWQSGISAQRKISQYSSTSVQVLRNEAFLDGFEKTLSVAHTAQASFSRTLGERSLSISIGNTWVANTTALTGSANYSRPLAGLQQSWTLQHGISQNEAISRDYLASWQVSKQVSSRIGWQSGLSLSQSEGFAEEYTLPGQFSASVNLGTTYKLNRRSQVTLTADYQQQRDDWQQRIEAAFVGLTTGFSHQINQTLTLSGNFNRRTVLAGNAEDSWMSSLSLRQQIR